MALTRRSSSRLRAVPGGPSTGNTPAPWSSDSDSAKRLSFPQTSTSPPSTTKDVVKTTALPADFMLAITRAQTLAQANLLSAVASERAKRWTEAIEYYRKLLQNLRKDKLPSAFLPGPDYTQLILETYYHVGVAFQKLDSHRKALEAFTNAIENAHIRKYACQIGCVSRNIYHTPVFARRAYAYIKCGKIKEAICDANKAVILDPLNSDVYCIRALVWNSAKEKRRALIDLNLSFKLNSAHVCTLILRGAIINSLGGVSAPDHNQDHEKAFSMSQDSRQFFDVVDFHSPKMPSFYDKYLWSLNVFHTIMEINLFTGAAFVPTSGISCTHAIHQWSFPADGSLTCSSADQGV
ncbi:uncharacterized protein LOC128328459 isoform X2 [Hemicordylus capensis]|uniref:uncharacterized protein LOC128328459 isoform X2 n=2 Tax=Hemicordylus capensis TaxID=884348 RepID=UPI002303C9A3|nr:uncharacterized protein LOC128328459 isoform X2 [Hemicordylus capensis]